jgi:hypothetical protein
MGKGHHPFSPFIEEGIFATRFFAGIGKGC